MSINALQGAAIIAGHATFTKMLLSFTYRTYQFLEWDEKRREQVAANLTIQEFQKAQNNETEYAALLVAILLYLSLVGRASSMAATTAVVGQIGYVWIRTVFGYPTVPAITAAVVRYGGLVLLVAELWSAAFAKEM
jgi:uncharacterized MAPEG superfamily protein